MVVKGAIFLQIAVLRERKMFISCTLYALNLQQYIRNQEDPMNRLKSKLQSRSNSLFISKLMARDEHRSRLSVDSSQIQQNKFQRTYVKSQYQAIKNPLAQSTNIQNEKQTLKLIKTKKPSLSIQRHSHRKPFEITEPINNLQQANAAIKNMIHILQSNFVLNQKQSNSFSIKIEDFNKLLQTVLLFKTNCLKQRLLKENSQFNHCLLSLWKAVEGQVNKTKAQGFKYSHRVNIQISHEDYQYELMQEKQKIWELQTQRKQKEAVLNDLNQSLRECFSQKQAIKLTIHNKEAYLSELCKRCDQQERLLCHLQTETAKKQQFLRHVQQRQEGILNFVNNQQKSRIIKMASQDYKQIESDLYEYAVYLQANQLASSLTYEHLPIVCHTHNLEQEVDALCKGLLHDGKQSLKEKCFKMKKFLLEVHERYRKQGVEIGKLMDFKTKWIIKYVQKMKMWLNNWELKQEYLKNLRIQFLLTHEKIMNVLINSRKKKYCQTCRQFNSEQKQKVIELCLKISENFEMGNSFY